jgi:hypothetical protein
MADDYNIDNYTCSVFEECDDIMGRLSQSYLVRVWKEVDKFFGLAGWLARYNQSKVEQRRGYSIVTLKVKFAGASRVMEEDIELVKYRFWFPCR